jgi:hypothetical protein
VGRPLLPVLVLLLLSVVGEVDVFILGGRGCVGAAAATAAAVVRHGMGIGGGGMMREGTVVVVVVVTIQQSGKTGKRGLAFSLVCVCVCVCVCLCVCVSVYFCVDGIGHVQGRGGLAVRGSPFLGGGGSID